MSLQSQTQSPPQLEPRLSNLTDTELERRLGASLAGERTAMVEFLLHLGEFDRRRTYLDRGYPSLFDYCIRALHLSKAAAFRRIAAARLLRRFPKAGDMLRDGRLCVTTLAELRDLLTETNSDDVFRRASGLTREQVEALVAASRPAVEAPPDSVRSLPPPRLVSLPLEALPAAAQNGNPPDPASTAQPGNVVVAVPWAPADRVKPISAELRVLRVTVTQTFLDELAEVKLILSHTVPDGRFEDVVRECFQVVLQREHARRGPKTETARPARERELAAQVGSAGETCRRKRYISRAVKREVWARDRGRCAFRAPDGRVCGSRYRVQFHHCEPYGVGGEATVENISLRCAAHNAMHARRDYGPGVATRGRAAKPTPVGQCERVPLGPGGSSAGETGRVSSGSGPRGSPENVAGRGRQRQANNP